MHTTFHRCDFLACRARQSCPHGAFARGTRNVFTHDSSLGDSVSLESGARDSTSLTVVRLPLSASALSKKEYGSALLAVAHENCSIKVSATLLMDQTVPVAALTRSWSDSLGARGVCLLPSIWRLNEKARKNQAP